MKKIFLITLLFLAFSINGFTQDKETDSLEMFLDEFYEGGEREFLELIYKNVKFPAEARGNCISGVSSMTVTFGKRGRMISIQQKYPLGGGLQQEVSRVTKLTMNNWKSHTEDTSFTFTIAFMVGERDKLKADVRVITYGMPEYERCPTTKQFEKKLSKALNKGKYTEAKEYCEQLLQRHPFSKTYLAQYEWIIQQLTKE